MRSPILTTGLSGLVGSKIAETYSGVYNFTNLDISNIESPTDITDLDQVKQRFSESDALFVVHLAAFTNVNAAWEQNGDKDGLAYKVNVVGTENIVKACKETGKHLIHISTAYVFNGEKDGLYTEEDALSPIEWYGETKARAEEVVQESDIDWTILRIDVPFRSDPFPRPDVIRKSLELAEKGIPLFDNHYIGPTFIDDFAKVVDWVIRTKETGLFNASSGEKWSDYELTKKVIELHNLDIDLKKGDLAEYLKTLNRPYQKNTAMSNEKLVNKLDFKLNSVEDSIKLLEL